MRYTLLFVLFPALIFFAGCTLFPSTQSPQTSTVAPVVPSAARTASPQTQTASPQTNADQTVSPAPVAQPKTVTVTIANFAFNPATINIKAGDTVKWVNDDQPAHKLFSGSISGFQSAALNTGDNYSFTFVTAGTFDYYCQIHPTMQGTVVVQ